MTDVFRNDSANINRVSFLSVCILVMYFLIGCASTTTTSSVSETKTATNVSVEDIELHRNNQQKWILTLDKGMNLETAVLPVLSHRQHFFQYRDGETLYQYMQGQYPITGLLFGLFFENGQLTSLILDQDVILMQQVQQYVPYQP